MLISRFGHRGNILFHLLQVFPFGRRHLFRWIIRRHLFRWIIHNYLGGESGTGNYASEYTKIWKYYSPFFWAGSWMSTKLSLLERKVRILKYFIQSKHSYGGFLFFCRCHFEQCICGTNHALKIISKSCARIAASFYSWHFSGKLVCCCYHPWRLYQRLGRWCRSLLGGTTNSYCSICWKPPRQAFYTISSNPRHYHCLQEQLLCCVQKIT